MNGFACPSRVLSFLFFSFQYFPLSNLTTKEEIIHPLLHISAPQLLYTSFGKLDRFSQSNTSFLIFSPSSFTFSACCLIDMRYYVTSLLVELPHPTQSMESKEQKRGHNFLWKHVCLMYWCLVAIIWLIHDVKKNLLVIRN